MNEHPPVADTTTPGPGPCCAPSSISASASDRPSPAEPSAGRETGTAPATRTRTATMVGLEGGSFLMGGDDADGHPADGEGPIRSVTIDPFEIDAYTVTNADFAAFIADTGYTTTAEVIGWSFVFGGLLPDEFPETRGVAAAPWWRQVFGADWAHPEGPHSHVGDRSTHPVVHLSWFDAVAYCRWAGRRLPTEAEWEFAARGGVEQQRFPWGDELVPGGRHHANVWQGDFPAENSSADGWYGTAPVDAYHPNGFGLFNVVGNVWEWTSDWFGVEHGSAPATNPAGPAHGTHRVMRGGSYLCHESYCTRYRLSARSAVSPDSSTGNLGLRCAG